MIKTLKTNISEVYLLISILYYWSLTAIVANWFAISLLAITIILITTQNKILGITFGVLLVLINLYMVLALLSEFSEFKTTSLEAIKLLSIGSLFLGLNLIFSGVLLHKYAKLSTIKVVPS